MLQAEELVGMAMVHSLVDMAQTWITDNVGYAEDVVESQCTPEDKQISLEPFKPVLDARASGGKWHFVVGLVVSI
jgi:hypothetical protein